MAAVAVLPLTTLAEIAEQTGVGIWRLRKWADADKLNAKIVRLRGYRCIATEDLPAALQRIKELAQDGK